MRKMFAFAVALLAAAASAYAVRALPGSYPYTQPDGSVITLTLHGDEFFHWRTDASGQVVVKGIDGFYRPSSINPSDRLEAKRLRQVVNQERVRRPGLRGTNNSDPMTHGERRIPVILVEFSDVKFSLTDPASKFDAMLNKEGYSASGATGSVRDYYYQNSHGGYLPVFDVFGPVTLSGDMATYGTEMADAALAVSEGATLLDSEINFSDYDYDDDGYVDMILMYFAGYNEAERGPEESIWPHQWVVYGKKRTKLDGKTLGRYFCTSELKGSSGTNMCGIGTTCHEFAHSLGLPDFYDTDYEENGQCGGLYWFSIMCSGNYLNDGRTPPYFNSEERIMLGWMSDADVPILPEGGTVMTSVANDVAYRSPTATEGEYFVYECRDRSGWDSYLPEGLLVYHADKSVTRSVGGITPYAQWDQWESYNSINAYGDHPCFYVVPSSDQNNLNYYPDYLNGYVFPGLDNVVTYTPIDWEGNETGLAITGISYENSRLSLTAAYSSVPGVDPPEEGVTLSSLGVAYIDTETHLFVPAEGDEPLSVEYESTESELVATATYADGRKEEIRLRLQ